MQCLILENILIQSHFTVCYDIDPPEQCKSTIAADRTGQTCSDTYMVIHCKKSCGLCPGRTFYGMFIVKNHSVDEVKKLRYYQPANRLSVYGLFRDLLSNGERSKARGWLIRRQFSNFNVCALPQSRDIRRNVPRIRKLIEPAQS